MRNLLVELVASAISTPPEAEVEVEQLGPTGLLGPMVTRPTGVLVAGEVDPPTRVPSMVALARQVGPTVGAAEVGERLHQVALRSPGPVALVGTGQLTS